MVQNTSQHWTFEQDTTIFLYTKPPSPRLHSPYHLACMSISQYFWTCTSSSILPGPYDRNIKGFQLHNCLSGCFIIFSGTVEEHLNHNKQVFKKLRSTHLSMKLIKCHFFTKEIKYLGHILSTKGIRLLASKTEATRKHAFKNSQAIPLLTNHQAKFEWTPTHHNAFF